MLHCFLLLLPTLLVMPEKILTWPYLVFGSAVIAAAIVESQSLSARNVWTASDGIVADMWAQRVAQIVGLVLFTLFWLAQAEALWQASDVEPWLCLCGAILVAVGVGLRAVAIRTLGRHFVSDIRVEQVVRTGVYRWLRHPSEIGLVMMATGVPLLLGSTTSSFLALFILTPFSLWRVGREEAALRLADHEKR